jgi:SNF2 family DNA or RNA helicase
VHKLVCAGTVEEKVDQLLEKKRDLALRIVASTTDTRDSATCWENTCSQ